MINLFIKYLNVNDSKGIMLIRLSTGRGIADVCRKIFFSHLKTLKQRVKLV